MPRSSTPRRPRGRATAALSAKHGLVPLRVAALVARRGRAGAGRTPRNAPSRSAPLALMLRRDAGWLRAAAAVGQQAEAPVLSLARRARVRDHLVTHGASFLARSGRRARPPARRTSRTRCGSWSAPGSRPRMASRACACSSIASAARSRACSIARSRRTTPRRRRCASGRRDQARAHARPRAARPRAALAADRRGPVVAAAGGRTGRPSMPRRRARQLLAPLRRGVPRSARARVEPAAVARAARRAAPARGARRDPRRAVRHTASSASSSRCPRRSTSCAPPATRRPDAELCRVAATDPLNLVGVLSPGPRVPAIVGNAVLFLDGQPVASLEAGELVHRAPIPAGARASTTTSPTTRRRGRRSSRRRPRFRCSLPPCCTFLTLARQDPAPRSAAPRRGAAGSSRVFVLVQLLLPLLYYVRPQAIPHDERFAWRMFSPMRMARCAPYVADRRRAVQPRAASSTRRGSRSRTRGRFVVIEAMAARLCASTLAPRSGCRSTARTSTGHPGASAASTCARCPSSDDGEQEASSQEDRGQAGPELRAPPGRRACEGRAASRRQGGSPPAPAPAPVFWFGFEVRVGQARRRPRRAVRLLALDALLQIRHAPRYGAGGFNVAQLPGLDALGPARTGYELGQLVSAYLFVLARAAASRHAGSSRSMPRSTTWLYFGASSTAYQHHYLWR